MIWLRRGLFVVLGAGLFYLWGPAMNPSIADSADSEFRGTFKRSRDLPLLFREDPATEWRVVGRLQEITESKYLAPDDPKVPEEIGLAAVSENGLIVETKILLKVTLPTKFFYDESGRILGKYDRAVYSSGEGDQWAGALTQLAVSLGLGLGEGMGNCHGPIAVGTGGGYDEALGVVLSNLREDPRPFVRIGRAATDLPPPPDEDVEATLFVLEQVDRPLDACMAECSAWRIEQMVSLRR